MESSTPTNPLMVNYRHVPEDTKPEFEDVKGVKYCSKCNQEFGVFSGKHHCHGCGKIFCKPHCDLFLQLPDSFGYAPDTPVRVCQACFKKYNLIDFDKSYEEVGDPNAPAVIYVTGACTCRVIPPLLYDIFKGYYLLSPELPNLGSRSGEKLTTENAIETIKNLILEKVPSKKAVVFGYSMGGHLVMKFGKAHPELCHALIIGGACNVYPPGVKSSLFFGLSAFVYDTMPNSTTCTFVQKLLPKSMSKKDVEFLMRTGMYYKAWADCGGVMKEPEAGHYEKILATTEMPKLMIHGSKDFRSGEEVFKKAGNNMELVVIEGADHMIMMDPLYKEQFGAQLKEFVDKIYANVNKETDE